MRPVAGGRFRNGRRRLRVTLLAAAAAFAALAAIGMYAGHVFRSLELSSVDTRFRIRGDDGPARNIVVIGVDDKSFGALH